MYVQILVNILYPNKAIMEKETQGCWSGDKGLLKLGLNCGLDDGFDIWARLLVIVGAQLSLGMSY